MVGQVGGQSGSAVRCTLVCSVVDLSVILI